jgi:hypothetical protein
MPAHHGRRHAPEGRRTTARLGLGNGSPNRFFPQWARLSPRRNPDLREWRNPGASESTQVVWIWIRQHAYVPIGLNCQLFQ